ncbi:MAG: hypothetical protein ACK4TB_02430 [Gemmobacter sp.]
MLLQLDRVRRTAAAQGVEIAFDDSLIDMLAAEGFRPEYGARELKRQIRSLVETRLARAMLGGEVAQGDRVRIGWDAGAEQVRIEPVTATAPAESLPAAEDAKPGA